MIIDNVLSALAKCMEAYHQVTGVFGICPVSYTHLDVYKRQVTTQPYILVLL